jgi:hypothetical protein
MARKATTAASARDSCRKPIVAFSKTIAKIAMASYGSAASRSNAQSAAETPVATRSRMTSTS